MGLIKAGMGALGGTLADQWKEFFYCDSLDKDVLIFPFKLMWIWWDTVWSGIWAIFLWTNVSTKVWRT